MTIIKEVNYKLTDGSKVVKDQRITMKVQDEFNSQMYCIHRALKNQIKNNRIRNACVRNRSQVQGGGRKPWKQKGTGKARAGSIRSPIWKGGGIIFGPNKKIYKSKINKKEKHLAVSNIIYNKSANTVVSNEILKGSDKPNTKYFVSILRKLKIDVQKYTRILVVVEKKSKILYMSTKNLANIEIIDIRHLNTLSLLKADQIIITSNALNKLSLN